MRAAGHRTVPHTADVTLHAWGPTREVALAEIVAALVEGVLDTAGAAPLHRHELRLVAQSDRHAVAALLDEAIYLIDARDEVPVRTHLEVVADGRVEGWFELADASRVELVGSVPKGVALSGLVLEQDQHGWRCAATVDV